MAKKCIICNTNTIFFVWSSSRNFPREELGKKLHRVGNRDMKEFTEGLPVCNKCYDMLGKV